MYFQKLFAKNAFLHANFGLLINLFPINQPQRYIIIFKERTKKSNYENVFTYQADFEVVVV